MKESSHVSMSQGVRPEQLRPGGSCHTGHLLAPNALLARSIQVRVVMRITSNEVNQLGRAGNWQACGSESFLAE